MNILKNLVKTELLCPVGDLDSLFAAVLNGCDAVYLGGKNFSARANCSNLTDEELLFAIDYCHLHNVKIYIAVNTLYKNKELTSVFEFLTKMYKAGADGFIVQDIGTAFYINKYFKNISLCASTQMTIGGYDSANFLVNIGFMRVVLSRELMLPEIKKIRKNTKAEIEVFVHGALCVCYSGQCNMSSLIGGRSGNRGKCAQPCRLKYDLFDSQGLIESGYLLSPKDIMGLEILPEIVKAGVDSVKIEGRMKNSAYVSLTTKIYRKYLDKVFDSNYEILEEDVKKLTQIFSRGGSFSEGYFLNYSGYHMMSTKTPKSIGLLVGKVFSYDKKRKLACIYITEPLAKGDGIEVFTKTEPHVGTGIDTEAAPNEKTFVVIDGDINAQDLVYKSYDKKLNDEIKAMNLEDNSKKLNLVCNVKAKIGEKLYISLKYGNIFEYAQGTVVQPSINAPISKQRLLAQINKTDTYPFIFDFGNSKNSEHLEHLEHLEIEENIYLPMKEINSCRREVIDKFVKSFKESFRREIESPVKINFNKSFTESKSKGIKQLTVLVNTKEQFYAAINQNISRIYIESNSKIMKEIDNFIEASKENGIKLFLALPVIDSFDDFKAVIELAKHKNIDGYLIRTFGQLELLKDDKKCKVIDYQFNIVNSLSIECMKQFCDYLTLSYELNLNEILNIDIDAKDCEAVIYGRQTLMTTKQCPIGLYSAKKDGNKFCRLKNNTSGYYLKDRKNMEFPIVTDCDRCVALVLNSKVLFMLNKMKDMLSMPVGFLRLSFTIENKEQTEKLIRCYNKAMNGEIDTETYKLIDEFSQIATNGHFYRGVD